LSEPARSSVTGSDPRIPVGVRTGFRFFRTQARWTQFPDALSSRPISRASRRRPIGLGGFLGPCHSCWLGVVATLPKNNVSFIIL